MPRTKAPSGGTVSNNRFSPGGQFVAEPLEPVASVMARLRKRIGAALKLSREAPAVRGQWEHHPEHSFYTFKVKGRPYTINVSHPTTKNGIHLFKFEDAEGSMDVTGKGGAHEVLSHVGHALIDFAKNKATHPIGFDAEGASRVRVYKRLLGLLPKYLPDHEVRQMRDSEDKASWEIHKKPKITLARVPGSTYRSLTPGFDKATDPLSEEHDITGVMRRLDQLSSRQRHLRHFLGGYVVSSHQRNPEAVVNPQHLLGAIRFYAKHRHTLRAIPTPSLLADEVVRAQHGERSDYLTPEQHADARSISG